MRCLRRNATYSAPEKGRRTVTPLTTDELERIRRQLCDVLSMDLAVRLLGHVDYLRAELHDKSRPCWGCGTCSWAATPQPPLFCRPASRCAPPKLVKSFTWDGYGHNANCECQCETTEQK